MIKLDKISLPVFVIGAGVIHAIGVAAFLPMLITLPGPGSETANPHTVAVDVEIVPAPQQPIPASAAPSLPQRLVSPAISQPSPSDADDLTSALPDAPPSAEISSAPDIGEPEGDPVANLDPDQIPSEAAPPADSGQDKAEEPPNKKSSSPMVVKPKAAAKKPVVRAKPAKPAAQRTATVKKPQPIFKGAVGEFFRNGPKSARR